MKAKQKKNGKKNKKSSFKQRGPMYWVAMSAMGTLVAYSAFGSKTVSFAHTHENRGAITINQSQSPAARRFDIPPGPLDTVLNTFQNMTGVRVVVPNSDIGTIPSPGVTGVYTTEEALKKILTGTNVTYRFISSESVALEVSGPAASVDVSRADLNSIIAEIHRAAARSAANDLCHTQVRNRRTRRDYAA